MRRLKLLLASLALLVTLAGAVQPAAAVDVFKDACGTGGAKSSAACSDHTTKNPLTGPNGTFQRVTRIIASITGAVAVVMIIIGGVMYIFSGGDAGKVSTAKNTIIYAAVGLVIIVLAQSIIVFILTKL